MNERKIFRHRFFDALGEHFEQLDKIDQKNYVSYLLRNRKLLDRILNILPEGVLLVNIDRNLEFANESARKFLGLPKDYYDFALDRYLKELDWNIIEDFLEKKLESSKQELELFYPEHLILRIFLFPQFNNEQLEYVVVILENITGLRLEAESNKEKETLEALGMLSAGVAHELGNPLNNIKIYLQLCQRLLKKKDFSKSELVDLVHTSLEGVERLDKILKKFLGALKPVVLNLKLINVVELMKDVLKFMRFEIEARGIKIMTNLDGVIPLVNADETQLHQAFYNIIRNALQAMKRGKKLKISFVVQKDFLQVSFADSGKGMSLNDLRKIFNPYHTTYTGGTGLGLFIVEKIIRSHGGFINVNTKLGKGTVFEINIPLLERRLRIEK